MSVLLALVLAGCHSRGQGQPPDDLGDGSTGSAVSQTTQPTAGETAGSVPREPSAALEAGAATPVSSPDALAGEPSLSIVVGNQKRELSRSELLAHPALTNLTVNKGAVFETMPMQFKAVRMTALFDGLPVDETMAIEFDALDGFSASLDPKLLLNRDPERAIAYLAVEEADTPWPKLDNGRAAGPYYLVWENPERSEVGPEQWAYQLRSFRLTAPVEARFPGLRPANDLPADHPVRRGYESFLKNCFACHTLNGEGTSRLGPDLNEPYSPTEYLQDGFLQRLVRDPQSVRHYKGSRMSAFSEQQLSNQELDHLISYLKHKAEQRRTGKAATSP